ATVPPRRLALCASEADPAHLRGEALLLLDAGHVLGPGFLARAHAALAADPTVAMVTCRVRRAWASGRDELSPAPALDRAGLLADPWSAPRAALCRRAALVAVGDAETALHPFERVDVWLRLLAAGWRLLALDEALLVEYPRTGAEAPDRADAALEALGARHVAPAAEGAAIPPESPRRPGGAGRGP